MIRRLACLVGWHRPPEGVDRKWSLIFVCERCGSRVVGELGRALERRR